MQQGLGMVGLKVSKVLLAVPVLPLIRPKPTMCHKDLLCPGPQGRGKEVGKEVGAYWGSRLVSCDRRRLLLSVIVCLVDAAARWPSNARISCFSRWEICSSRLIISVRVSSSVRVHGG